MKKYKIKLPFGVNKENTIIHISEAERGKNCHCFCPDCHSPLVAVKGKIKTHHFKHSIENECPGGMECYSFSC